MSTPSELYVENLLKFNLTIDERLKQSATKIEEALIHKLFAPDQLQIMVEII